MDLQELLTKNSDFKTFVEKNCIAYNLTTENCLKLAIIKEYARYLVDRRAGKFWSGHF